MRIVAVANQKGGVGKTTTAVNLASGLSLLGYRTLLVDLDPQANATMTFVPLENIDQHIYDVLMSRNGTVDHIIQQSSLEKLDVVPARIGLAKLESQLMGEIDAYYRLKDRLHPVLDRYDFIVIDTPPALGLLTVNALVASQWVLVPIQVSFYALEGTEDLLETISKVKQHANPDLSIIGVVVTMVDRRTVMSRDVLEQVHSMFGPLVFKTSISRSVRLEESPAYRECIHTYAPNSTSAREYKQLAQEVVQRVEKGIAT